MTANQLIFSAFPRSLQQHLNAVGQMNKVSELLCNVLKHDEYKSGFVSHLFTLARDKSFSWVSRKVAIFALEHQILFLSETDYERFDHLFVELGLKSRGLSNPLYPFVLKEGYSSCQMSPFVSQFRQRLKRWQWIHDRLQGEVTTTAALKQVIHHSQLDCHLTLARYLITPKEVEGTITNHLLTSSGLIEPLQNLSAYASRESKRMLSTLPPLEAAVMQSFCQSNEIYWSTPSTPRSLHALVEAPIDTVATVIKLPGSSFEFEIKRTGMGQYPYLDIRHSRNGYPVASSHRLQGASLGWMTKHESHAASLFGRLYRLVHGEDPPVSRTLVVKNINTVPTEEGKEEFLHNFFTRPDLYGRNFAPMRKHMTEASAAFRKEQNLDPLASQTPLGKTLEFLRHVNPKQSILIQTSSLRIDLVASYLAADGADRYFRMGLGLSPDQGMRQQFADQILDEILGDYRPPNIPYIDHSHYISAAFDVPQNRERGDSCYLNLLEQVGRLWGTLMALRGYSKGESFASRNMGLRMVWEKAQWQIRLYALDHDCLDFECSKRFHPKNALAGMAYDHSHLFGRAGKGRIVIGSVPYLERIYQIGLDRQEEGRALLQRITTQAYRKTLICMQNNSVLSSYYEADCIQHLLDWDTILKNHVLPNINVEQGNKLVRQNDWESRTRAYLQKREYSKESTEQYIRQINGHQDFLRKIAFLYEE